jgi:hypothetical protein
VRAGLALAWRRQLAEVGGEIRDTTGKPHDRRTRRFAARGVPASIIGATLTWRGQIPLADA